MELLLSSRKHNSHVTSVVPLPVLRDDTAVCDAVVVGGEDGGVDGERVVLLQSLSLGDSDMMTNQHSTPCSSQPVNINLVLSNYS